MKHGRDCPRPYGSECRKFSTDGTLLGADIAHTFGTTDEDEIADMDEYGSPDPGLLKAHTRRLTGMDEEQAEWESEDGSAWQ